MKPILLLILMSVLMICCKQQNPGSTASNASSPSPTPAGQSAVQDNESMKDVVNVAIGSPDHKTLVTAVTKAELVDALSNAGPFTVFAPTDAAFAKLPAGTVENLIKPEQKSTLQNILQYHVMTSALKSSFFKDGMQMGMVNGDNITFQVKDGKVMINNSATIVASVPASNGIVHVIDAVLLPPSK